ncbi:MAG TPA: LacI family DNA-binding transcriptional regulator [Candidatus Alistipes merdigallinarum]|nr:LacI family DNA-binding transcriptional regulator [Candidatus Alistipes merdigallinarum]
MKNSEKKVTIKDVAQLAGVSKGTVDRVIHNRGEVSAESLKRVLDVIDRIGYKPNVYASLLASRRHYRIVCLIPDFEAGEFWEIAYKGIVKAYEECRDFNVTVDIVRYDQFRLDSFRQACRDTLDQAPDAVLIVPMFSDSASEFVSELHARQIPFVFIESKLPDAPYMAYFGMPVFESGYLSARLLLKHQRAKEVACFRFHRSGDALSNTASIRQQGFSAYLEQHDRGACKLWVDYLYPSVCDENTKILDCFFERHPEVRHIVVFNSRSYIVAEYLQSRGMNDRVLLGFDPLERNVAAMKAGYIEYIIAQKCETQAYRGVKALCNYFVFKAWPSLKDNYMSMEVLTAENVNYYTDLAIE